MPAVGYYQMSNTPLFAQASCLAADRSAGYISLRIPSPKDQQITELIKSWMKLDEVDRIRESASLTSSQMMTLIVYAHRVAAFAVRERNANPIRLGLIAIGLA